LGCPPTAIGVEELIRIGARNIIRIGTCGAIQPFLEPGHMIIATGAVRGEHTSEEFINMEYPAVADYRIVRALIDACEKLHLPYHLGIVRSHDAFYLESPWALGDYRKRLQPWVDMGVLALENESSAIFVISGMQGVRAGTILASGYSILEEHEEKIHEEENIRKMVSAAIEAAKLLHERGLAE
jgi:uridine phosphorylase